MFKIQPVMTKSVKGARKVFPKTDDFSLTRSQFTNLTKKYGLTTESISKKGEKDSFIKRNPGDCASPEYCIL